MGQNKNGFYHKRTNWLTVIYLLIGLAFQNVVTADDAAGSSYTHEDLFFYLIVETDNSNIAPIIAELERTWQPNLLPVAIETMIYSRSVSVSQHIAKLLEKKTGQTFGNNAHEWYTWMWNQDENISSGYADFKAKLYKNIDSKFEKYFAQRQTLARIRLDEIRWGGVVQDGIPPLRSPKMIPAKKADYLEDDNVVFGIEINGDARAYPKRILAWHEMFVDTIGGIEIAGVYCTLCGTVIPYKTRVGDKNYQLGTSGFLYRSNKLMYDKKTQSLWNTIMGTPVVGPLVDKGITLERLSVVTTTWNEWRRRHPDTTVLSLNTGHNRDYGEGVAYDDYFSNDRLMFHTPFNDTRLKNKQEVLALQFPSAPKDQLAIDTDFLQKNPLFTEQIGRQKILVLTDHSGANRVYDPEDINFKQYDGDSTVTDDLGREWRLQEESLSLKNKRHLKRLPYHRAFWFGWHATYPETRLIK